MPHLLANVTEDNGNELNETERNVTGALTQEEPKVKSGFTTLDEVKAVSRTAKEALSKAEAVEIRIANSRAVPLEDW